MNEPFLRFEWHVSPVYHWQDWLDAHGKRVVVPADVLARFESCSAVERAWGRFEKENKQVGPVIGPVLNSGKPRTYSPMQREHATLFRTFADLNCSDSAAILNFATTYGLLGVPMQDQAINVPGPSGSDRYHRAIGESHLTWAREICLMRKALELAKSRTPAETARDRANWNRVGLEPPHDERRKELTWLFNVHLQHVQGRMIFEPDIAPRLSFAPLSLLSAMWLQLALSVSGDKQFRQCKYCSRLFEISTEQTGFRSHREFCSASCKTNDYRRRKRTALELAKMGLPLSTIAERIETNKATVRGWLPPKRNARLR